MSRLTTTLWAAFLAVFLSLSAGAQPAPVALAQQGPGAAKVSDEGGTVVLSVPMTQAVPWKVEAVDAPPRILVEFGDLAWTEPPKVSSQSVAGAEIAKVRAGWTQLSLVLREPLSIASAQVLPADKGGVTLEVRMLPSTGEEFRKAANPEGADQAAPTIISGDLTVVALDPGHGGIDPGAMSGDAVEAELMLAMARRAKEALVRTGRFRVVLTRDEDVFVPLEDRLSRAREAGADVFVSLHADALAAEDGAASGLSVYRLADDAEDPANSLLTERHAGTDLLSGVDLTGAGDDVALALLDIVRRDTAPRALALQSSLVDAFLSARLKVNSRPRREGALSVLKSADIPSVLVELGFLSSEADLTRLSDPAWQEQAAQALAEGLMIWQDEDRLRQGGN